MSILSVMKNENSSYTKWFKKKQVFSFLTSLKNGGGITPHLHPLEGWQLIIKSIFNQDRTPTLLWPRILGVVTMQICWQGLPRRYFSEYPIWRGFFSIWDLYLQKSIQNLMFYVSLDPFLRKLRVRNDYHMEVTPPPELDSWPRVSS